MPDTQQSTPLSPRVQELLQYAQSPKNQYVAPIQRFGSLLAGGLGLYGLRRSYPDLQRAYAQAKASWLERALSTPGARIPRSFWYRPSIWWDTWRNLSRMPHGRMTPGLALTLLGLAPLLWRTANVMSRQVRHSYRDRIAREIAFNPLTPEESAQLFDQLRRIERSRWYLR